MPTTHLPFGPCTPPTTGTVEDLAERIRQLTYVVTALRELADKRAEAERAAAARAKRAAEAEKHPPRSAFAVTDAAAFSAHDAARLSAQFSALGRQVRDLQIARGLIRAGEAPRSVWL